MVFDNCKTVTIDRTITNDNINNNYNYVKLQL